jgi:tRNA A37 methylthiotransferase MiaB
MANPKGVHGIREELAETFRDHDELYNFLHVPVQSGSDAVLGDMRRQHQVREFREVVETFDRVLDDWTLATDFIVGYPTETEADHEASLALLREVRPGRVNVTRFSKRPGTDAAELKGLGGTRKKARSKAMTEVKREVVGAAYDALVGSRRRVHVVEPGTGDSAKAYDGAYRQVVIQDATAQGVEPGQFLDVEVTAARGTYALGEPA